LTAKSVSMSRLGPQWQGYCCNLSTNIVCFSLWIFCAPLKPIWYEIARQTDLDMAWKLQKRACTMISTCTITSPVYRPSQIIWPNVGLNTHNKILTITFSGHNFFSQKREVIFKLAQLFCSVIDSLMQDNNFWLELIAMYIKGRTLLPQCP